MKTASKTLGKATLILGLAGLVACGGTSGPSYDPDSPEGQAYEYRHSLMHVAGVKMEFINNMARELIDVDEAAFLKATAELAVLTAMMPETLENQTLVAESRAEPSIWQEPDDFNARMNNALEATARLAEATATGGFAAGQALVTASIGTSSNCSGCHNTYRKSETE
jgi:cytochrome c556